MVDNSSAAICNDDRLNVGVSGASSGMELIAFLIVLALGFAVGAGSSGAIRKLIGRISCFYNF